MEIPEKPTTGISSVRFFANWWIMAESRDTDEKRLAFYDAIMRYAFRGERATVPTSESQATVWAAWDGFNVCRPIIDGLPEEIELHGKRASAGRLGGIASGIARVEAKPEANDEAKEEAKNICFEANDEANRSNPLEENMNMNMNMNKHIVRKRDISNFADAFFEGWWKSYPGPRKIDKKKCRAKFADILKESSEPANMAASIMDGLELWKKSDLWLRDDGRFIRAPLVWLNNRNWEDAPGVSAQSQQTFDAAEFAHKLREEFK